MFYFHVELIVAVLLSDSAEWHQCGILRERVTKEIENEGKTKRGR